MRKEFDLKQYLKEGWLLLQEAEVPTNEAEEDYENWEQEYREWAQEGGWDDETIDQVIQIGNQHPEWIPDICGYGDNPVDDFEVFVEDPEAYMQSSIKDRAVDMDRRRFAYYNNLKEAKKFDYKQYLKEGWLLQEAKGQPVTTADLKGFSTKDATLSREKRTKKGNWKGSVGKYVEDHRAEIDAAAAAGGGKLRSYVISTMKPALSPEAQDYVDELLKGYASSRQLHQALYNVMLKGAGLGLHEVVED